MECERGNLRSQYGDLVVHVLNGVIQIESQAAHLTLDCVGLRLGGDEISLRGVNGGLGDVDLDLVWFLVELHQQIAFVHPVVVIDQNANDLSGHARSYECHVPVDVGVVR